jgi:hypothetical protein
MPRLRRPRHTAARSLSANLHNSQLESVEPLSMLLSLALGSIGSALRCGYLAAPRFLAVVSSCTLIPLICNESTGAHHYISSLSLHIVYRPNPGISGNLEIFEISVFVFVFVLCGCRSWSVFSGDL